MALIEPQTLTLPAFLEAQTVEHVSLVVFAEAKAGKTRLIGTFPDVMVIASSSERGYTTLLDDHPNKGHIKIWPVPEVDAAGQPTGKGVRQSIMDAVGWFQANHQAYGLKSIAFDVMSVLADLVHDEITEYGATRMLWGKKRSDGREEDPEQEQRVWTWQNYTRFFADIRDRLHSLPVNIAYTFHSEEKALNGVPLGFGPRMKGKAALDVFTTSVQFVLYLDTVELPVDETNADRPGARVRTETVRRLWTRCPQVQGAPFFITGVRHAHRFPEPVIRAHYNEIADRLFGKDVGARTPR